MSNLSKFSPNVFRAYDIRGIYGKDLTDQLAEAVALSYATMLGNSGEVLLGRDVRLSGKRLMESISKGLREGGCNTVNVGLVPTPTNYFGVVQWKMKGGVQITASHNPPEWNGMKLVTEGGETVSEGSGMEELKKRVLEGGWIRSERKGVEVTRDLIPEYIEFLISKIEVERRLKIAVDYSNGASAVVFPKIAEQLDIEVIGLNSVPDGLFPGHLPEPSEETLRDLQRVVKEGKVDFGAGFDGDADRVVFIDDKGRIMPGDITLAVFVKYLKKRGKVLYDVNCSSVLSEVILESGCEPVETRVGRAFMLRDMRRLGAVLGGEKSNHLYFPEVWGFDDAIYALLRMAELVSKLEVKLSEIVDTVPIYPSTPIMVFDCPDEIKWKAVEKIAEKLVKEGLKVNRLDGVKAYFDDGWILIRPSNTMPQIKMSAEARTEERLREIVEYGKKLIQSAIST
ncbi:MAG: phosphomannomutase/phosphoglucomutase [Candidatus Caldarchaeales archaeon]